MTALANHLGQVSVSRVNLGHALQPGPPELGGARIGVCQAILQVHQHLGVLLMLLHLSRGHQNSPYTFGQIFHLCWEIAVLWNRESPSHYLLSFQKLGY